jgi:hypothetical protein
MYSSIVIRNKMDLQTYYQKNLVINNRILKYKGLFRVNELMPTINRALEERGYTKREKKTEELVNELGKRTYVELRPLKTKTKYIKLVLKIKLTLDNVTQVVEEIKEEKKNFDKGDILVAFDAWVLTDYGHRWEQNPVVYFLKGVINKYIYNFPLEGSAPGEVAADTAYVFAHIRKLLNSYKQEVRAVVKEEDVMKEMAEDVKKG